MDPTENTHSTPDWCERWPVLGYFGVKFVQSRFGCLILHAFQILEHVQSNTSIKALS